MMTALAASLPMGDDTPVLIYALVGGGAVILLILSAVLGKRSDSKKNQKGNKRKP